jgi:hypothetical protein
MFKLAFVAESTFSFVDKKSANTLWVCHYSEAGECKREDGGMKE